METLKPDETETEQQIQHLNPSLLWTESEWFQTWLRLAREKYEHQESTEQDQAA